jgi:hypothetical protein
MVPGARPFGPRECSIAGMIEPQRESFLTGWGLSVRPRGWSAGGEIEISRTSALKRAIGRADGECIPL